jgi:xanthine dehydrogenase accessory factor
VTDEELLRAVADAAAAGRPAALLTLTAFSGSVPREAGAKMAVFEDSTLGTIGGGRFESEVIQDARACIEKGHGRSIRYELSPSALGMYCGGAAEVFIDVLSRRMTLVILGGGHVAEKLAELAAFLGVPHSVVDDRPEYAVAARFPRARQVLLAQPDEALRRLGVGPDTAVAVVTRCHGFDLRCLIAALKTPAFYVGMIGSREKTRRLFDLCLRRGLDPAAEDRVRAPIGLDLGGSRPEDIALSIMAEIAQLRHGASGRPLKETLVERTQK